ncbi:MAG TPA: carbohydrate kinase family protein [Thermomicrobiales bacterium]|nr:carbohydrate kinase family protein [Thermomicrobiales bacterium]
MPHAADIAESNDMTRRLAAARRVCVVGNLNIDLIIRGVAALPVWGQEVAGTSHVAASAGQGGYLAMALGRLGVPTSVVANVGDDLFGRQILDDLAAGGVDAGAVETAPGTTGITVGIVRPDGERAFVSDFACLRDFDEALIERHWDRIAAADVVCLVAQFCLPRLTPDAVGRVLARARAAGMITMLDTGWDPAGWPPETARAIRKLLAHVDIFLPNADEATALTDLADPQAAAAALQADGPAIVVVKQGAAGSLVLVGDEMAALPALPADVRDAVGAGDTFDASFLYGLLQGWAPAACLALGNAAAAIYVSRLADRFPTADETRRAAAAYGIDLAAKEETA